MILFSEHAVDRFRERVEPSLDRAAARAHLESLPVVWTGVPSRDGCELVLLGADGLVGVLDNAISRLVTVYWGEPDLLAGLRVAAGTAPEKSRAVSA